MSRFLRRVLTLATASLTAIAAGPVFVPVQAGTEDSAGGLAKINHVVVIYEENHSFDNLYGGWGGVKRRPEPHPPHPLPTRANRTPLPRLLPKHPKLAPPPPPSPLPP